MNRIPTLSYALGKILIALLSSLLLGLFFLIFDVLRGQQLGPIWAIPLITQFYSIPAYFLAGVPSSMMIDAFTYRMHSSFLRYITRVVLYSLAGILVIVLFQHFSQTGTTIYIRKPSLADVVVSIIFKALPALLFYHISILLLWTRKYR